jgi:hypothetical protein
MGHPKLAYRLLVSGEPQFEKSRDELFNLRVLWLRGKIERDLGLLEAAQIRLERVGCQAR